MLHLTDSNKKIGLRIAKAREAARESQADLAAALGVKREMVTYWENGTRPIKAETIIAIADRYNVSADWLLGLSHARTRDRSIEGAVSVTGLNEKSICFLNDHGKDSNVLKALNLLLDDENPDNYRYWDRLQRYLFALPGNYDLSISLEGINTTREEIYTTLLTANSAYIKDLRDRLMGGGKNG